MRKINFVTNNFYIMRKEEEKKFESVTKLSCFDTCVCVDIRCFRQIHLLIAQHNTGRWKFSTIFSSFNFHLSQAARMMTVWGKRVKGGSGGGERKTKLKIDGRKINSSVSFIFRVIIKMKWNTFVASNSLRNCQFPNEAAFLLLSKIFSINAIFNSMGGKRNVKKEKRRKIGLTNSARRS